MKGVLHVTVLLFSALRVQRWLLCVGALMIVVSYFMPEPAAAVPRLLGLVFPLVPTAFAGGLLLRYFATPRSMRLIPRARLQILGAMALATVAIAAIPTLVGWSAGLDLSVLPMLWIAAVTSALVLSQFVASTSVPGATVWLVVVVVLTQALQSASARALLRWIGQNPSVLIAIIVVAWGSFAFWFLSVRSLKHPSEVNLYGTRVAKVSATRETALRTFLFSTPSLVSPFVGGFMSAGFIVLCFGTLFTLREPGHSFADAFAKTLTPALAIGAYTGTAGWLAVQRSKVLWLRGGLDRLGLFRLCESQAWRSAGAAATALFVLLAIVWLVNPSIGFGSTVWLAFHLCVGACLLYLGLMRVRGWRVLDVLCAIALFGIWLASFAIQQLAMSKPWLMPAPIVVLLGAAFGLRLIAVHRWRRIDWLVCKPPRYTAREEWRAAH